MSKKINEDDQVALPAEQDLASTGAAADSAESDDKLQALPRLLRYAMLANRDESFAVERLVAEITALAPGRPLTLAWAKGTPPLGIALAAELDHLAVTKDLPDLRSLADCVRMLSLTVSDLSEAAHDHLRVGKALVQAYRQLPEEFDLQLTADIEAFAAGWAALPAASGFNRHHGNGAADNALAVGRKLARWRIEAAEANVRRQYREDADERRQTAAAGDGKTTEASFSDASISGDNLLVCRLDEAAMKNPKMRELITPIKSVVNATLPLVLVPPLHQVRAQLLSEFPYAASVIDFALADLVGRRTVRLRPLLMVGPAGGGKSRFARRLGEALSVGVWRTDASRSDGAAFGGTDKRWYSAEPCHALLAVAQAGHGNPLVLIDEIEKAATRSDYGRFWDCLLGFLEPETSSRYPDPALQTNLDLSEISYVATANTLDPLPSPLRDRFRIVSFPKPGAADLDALLPAIAADLAREQGLDGSWIEPISGQERDAIATHWGGGSIRRLRRLFEIVLRERDKNSVRN